MLILFCKELCNSHEKHSGEMEGEKELAPRACVESALGLGKPYSSKLILNPLGRVLSARASLVVNLDSGGGNGSGDKLQGKKKRY